MIQSSKHSMNAYAQAGVETAISSADPHKLISILFDGAIAAVHSAKDYMLQKDFSAKGKSVSKAIAMIGELASSLNYEANAELALNLGVLYAHMTMELLNASGENRPGGLDHVGHLLSELRGAWAAIRPESASSAPKASEPPSPQRLAVSYGKV